MFKDNVPHVLDQDQEVELPNGRVRVFDLEQVEQADHIDGLLEGGKVNLLKVGVDGGEDLERGLAAAETLDRLLVFEHLAQLVEDARTRELIEDIHLQ